MTGVLARQSARDHLKWGFFALMALATLLVIYTDERFLITPNDPEWRHIQPFKWLLLVHGPFGAIALLTGPWQFSDRLRKARPQVHRWLGRIYIGAIAISSPIAFYMGVRFERHAIHIEQVFQGGGWFLTTAIALICILSRNIAAHKIWMMRSYGFCLVFILSRVPDAIPGFQFTDQTLADLLWSLVIGALIVPDILLTSRELLRKRRLARV